MINRQIEAGTDELREFLNSAPPLVVDFDRTCVKTNLTLEFLLALLKQKPQYLLLVPIWLLRGRAYLAKQIARRTCIDVSLLPYRTEFLKYLTTKRQEGCSLSSLQPPISSWPRRLQSILCCRMITSREGKYNPAG